MTLNLAGLSILQGENLTFDRSSLFLDGLLKLAQQEETAGQHFPRPPVRLTFCAFHPLQTIEGAQLIFVVTSHRGILAAKS